VVRQVGSEFFAVPSIVAGSRLASSWVRLVPFPDFDWSQVADNADKGSQVEIPGPRREGIVLIGGGMEKGGSFFNWRAWPMIRRCLLVLTTASLAGCSLLPDIAHQPTLHNPYPQLSTIAIAPFINLSDEPTVDGRDFALAYYNELQLVPGFEVIPVNVVEQAIRTQGNRLNGPEDARRLAQSLGADAVVIGAVTDYSPYYPPRLAMKVEWYAANPCFHPIPPGYGLPWGTPGEEHIPGPLVFEAEMALAREQLKTQTPVPPASAIEAPPGADSPPKASPDRVPDEKGAPQRIPAEQGLERVIDGKLTQYREPMAGTTGADATAVAAGGDGAGDVGLPADWPDPRGFISPPPRRERPACSPNAAPVLQHTQTYNGHDPEFTEALASYYYFRDDARFGGWQSYLERSDDFIRFCCHMHIWEMLGARGGAGETRVVWRWSEFR
jgi:hypothetical protein